MSHKGEDKITPIRTLVGFKRITLNPTETKTVILTITPKQYALISLEGKSIINASKICLSAGGKQPGFSGVANAKTTSVLKKEIVLSDN